MQTVLADRDSQVRCNFEVSLIQILEPCIALDNSQRLVDDDTLAMCLFGPIPASRLENRLSSPLVKWKDVHLGSFTFSTILGNAWRL